MTQRSEWKQFKLETKAKFMAWVANRLFSLSNNGVDGAVKRALLPQKNKAPPKWRSDRTRGDRLE